MKSREELIERLMKQHEQYMQGKIKRLEAENDVLHSGVGTLEFQIYVDLFERAKEIFEKIQIRSHDIYLNHSAARRR